MKPASLACCKAFRPFFLAQMLALVCALAAAQPAPGEVADIVRPTQAQVLFDDGVALPPDTAAWQTVDLPFSSDRAVAWYRIQFEARVPLAAMGAVYLPYLYGGGRLYLNGAPLAAITEPSAELVVRWERPHFVLIPSTLWRVGTNTLLMRVVAEPVARRGRVPLLAIGPQAPLQADYEARYFWVRTMSQFHLLATLVIGPMVLLIWWRRREERLYALFGLAILLWGARSLNLVIETLPVPLWALWRLVYHSATGGFILVLMVFLLHLARLRLPRVERFLWFYWLLGPVGFVLSGGSEMVVGRYWSGGLIPICLALFGVGVWHALRQRTVELVAFSVALTLAVVAGIHDFLVTSSAPLLGVIAPQSAAHRVFLLHYAGDLVLLVMGGILTARFIQALGALAQLNRTLETRVAEREQALTQQFAQVRALERQHAADEERQRIMRDLHDGLGSQLFVTLSRVQAGEVDRDGIVQALGDCISDMRLTFDAMSPDDNDFLMAWGNFRYRWERQLREAQVASVWAVDSDSAVIEAAPHAGLQLLRIAQEGLTNVLKHAQARQVMVRLDKQGHCLRMTIADDGQGMGILASGAGRGLPNMRARAQRLGARLHVDASPAGTVVALEIDLQPAA